MLKTLLIALLPLFTFFGNGTDKLIGSLNQNGPANNSGTLEKMIVSDGSVALDLDLNRINGRRTKQTSLSPVKFDVERDSFFTVLVFNDELRGPTPSSMNLVPQSTPAVPAKLAASFKNLIVENGSWGGPFDLVIRD